MVTDPVLTDDDPPGGPPPPHLRLPVDSKHYHWEEEFPGELFSRSLDWFGMDEMEKGLLEEKDKIYDHGKGREDAVKAHTAMYSHIGFTIIDRIRHGVSLVASFLGRAPQNTPDWPLRSPTDYYDASVSIVEGNRGIDGGNWSPPWEASTSPETGHCQLERMNQQNAWFISSRRPAFARKKLSEVLPSDDTPYESPTPGSTAVLLEKAVLCWRVAPRYVGLYPHSADPPIHIVSEYPPASNRIKATKPARSHKYSYHHHRSLRGATPPSKLAKSFLTSALQAVKAFGAIILRVLVRVPLIGRIYKKVVPARYRTRRNKHLKQSNKTRAIIKESAVKTMEYPPAPECNTLDPNFLDWLNEEMIDQYNYDDGISSATSPPAEEPPPAKTDPMPSLDQMVDPAYMTDFTNLSHSEPTYTTGFGQYPHPNSHILYGPAAIFSHEPSLNYAEGYSFNSPTPMSPDWPNLVNFPGSPTSSSSDITDFDGMEFPYMGINPGLSLPTSQTVSPQTEGLETPIFTPRSTSVASPPQQLLSARKYACEYESCGHKEFDRPCDLNKHLKTHNKHLECDFEPGGTCQMKFSTEKDRKRHRETVHEKKRPYTCHICVKEGKEGKEGRFSRKDNLRIHRKKVHGVE